MGTEKKGMMELVEMKLFVDPEFQGMIPPLADYEFKQLEENILTAGEVYEPIAVWNGTIVDGHNRYKIIQDHPEVKWHTREMQFADKWEAFDWMYKNQLGRRNLTNEQRRYLLGKLYEARKHTHGGDRGNQYTKMATAEKRLLPKNTDGVSLIIAEEQHVGKTQVKDSYQYSKGIDAIRDEEPELAESILKAETKIPKGTIQDIGQAKPEDRHEMIQTVKEGKRIMPKPITEKPKEDKKLSEEDKELLREIKQDIKASRTYSTYTPTVDDFVDEFRNNSAPYISLLKRIITNYSTIIRGNTDRIIQLIDECITSEIAKIKEEIINEYA